MTAGGSRLIVVIAAVAIGASAGCGSSQPAYCSDRSSLEQSVKDLGNVDLQSGGVSAVQSQLKTIKSDAAALAGSAKSDFPSQSDAITSAVAALGTSVQQLPSSPSATELAAVGVNVKSVSAAFTSFSDATSSECS
jgi:hypothetical protein